MNYIEKKFIYYTECQLATLESLKGRKATSQSDLRRQQKIADDMVECLSAIDGLQPEDLRGCPRVSDMVEARFPAQRDSK